MGLEEIMESNRSLAGSASALRVLDSFVAYSKSNAAVDGARTHVSASAISGDCVVIIIRSTPCHIDNHRCPRNTKYRRFSI